MKTSNLKTEKMGLLKRFFTGYATDQDGVKIFIIAAGVLVAAYLVAHFCCGFQFYTVKYGM